MTTPEKQSFKAQHSNTKIISCENG